MSTNSKMYDIVTASGVRLLQPGTRVSTPRMGQGTVTGIEDYPGGYHLRYAVRLDDPTRWVSHKMCNYDPYFFPKELKINE